MHVGLIPPIPLLDEFSHGPFHLLLAHLLDNPVYLNHYRQEAQQGSFLTLDNGAHEHGAGEFLTELLAKAVQVGASEVVLPDELFSSSKTLERTSQALDLWEALRSTSDVVQKLQFMVVPQGETPYDWVSCLMGLYSQVTSKFPGLHFTVGLSKDYEMWFGGLPELLSKFILPLRRASEVKFDVHLLGWGRQLSVLSQLSKDFPWIRSTDSAKPFVYASAGIEIDLKSILPYPGRSLTYFSDDFSASQLQVARHNVRVFRNSAHWAERKDLGRVYVDEANLAAAD